MCGGIGLQGDDDLMWGGGDADEVPLDVEFEVGLLLDALLLVSIVSELVAEDAPLDRHIALPHEVGHASTRVSGAKVMSIV